MSADANRVASASLQPHRVSTFRRVRRIVVLGALLFPAAPAMVRAQADSVRALADSVRHWRAQRDSMLQRVDSLVQVIARLDSAAGTVVRFDYGWSLDSAVFHPVRSYGTLIFVGLAANATLGLDRDPCATGARVCWRGTYPDRWGTSDKIDHASVAYVLTSMAIGLGIRPRLAALLTCAAGAGYEFTQGYVSRKDMTADCASAILAAGIFHVLSRAR